MIWAYGTFDFSSQTSGNLGMSYHGGTDRDNWSMTIDSTGGASSSGTNGLDPADPCPTPTLVLKVANGSTLSTGYCTNGQVIYVANVVQGTWLGIGYGSSMPNTDIVSFEAGTSAATSVVQEMMADDDGRPTVTTPNVYTSTMTVSGGNI